MSNTTIFIKLPPATSLFTYLKINPKTFSILLSNLNIPLVEVNIEGMLEFIQNILFTKKIICA